MLRVTLLLTAVLTLSGVASGQVPADRLPPVAPIDEAPSITGGIPKVNIVYLVPSDRAFEQKYVAALENAIRSLRAWYGKQMPQSKTFTIASPVVRIVTLPHTAAWYAENPRPTLFTQFWDNVLADAFPRTGGSFNDPANIWAYYIDADPACGQCGGCGTSGVLVISANDLRGFTGVPWLPSCPGDSDSGGPNRYIGGLGHELGHAFGLPHPPDCDQGAPQCDHTALMWNGFRVYPDTYLRADEKTILDHSPFFAPATAKRRAIHH